MSSAVESRCQPSQLSVEISSGEAPSLFSSGVGRRHPATGLSVGGATLEEDVSGTAPVSREPAAGKRDVVGTLAGERGVTAGYADLALRLGALFGELCRLGGAFERTPRRREYRPACRRTFP